MHDNENQDTDNEDYRFEHNLNAILDEPANPKKEDKTDDHDKIRCENNGQDVILNCNNASSVLKNNAIAKENEENCLVYFQSIILEANKILDDSQKFQTRNDTVIEENFFDQALESMEYLDILCMMEDNDAFKHDPGQTKTSMGTNQFDKNKSIEIVEAPQPSTMNFHDNYVSI